MSEVENEPDLSLWSSTYGLLTAERVLEGFHLHLKHQEVITAIKNPRSMYYQLLRIPLKNIFNGIILQQAHDYQVYAQKLFIDFLLSGQNDKEESSPGANTREDLESQRTQLVEMGDAFNKLELNHKKLIAESQAALIKLSHELQHSLLTASKQIKQLLSRNKIIKKDESIQHAIRTAMTYDDKFDDVSSLFWTKIAEVLEHNIEIELRQKLVVVLTNFSTHRTQIDKILASYLEKTNDVGVSLRGYRSQFYQLILQVTELIKLLPDYRPDLVREEENRSSLNFDAKIGEA